MTQPQSARSEPSCSRTNARVPRPSRNCGGRDVRRRAILTIAACFFTLPLHAQQLIGYVSTKDAEVTGASDTLDGHSVLTGSVAVTAKDHTAPITLGRGGTVRVCQTSIVHLTESNAATLAAPLLFSLDRGAIEIQMTSTATDAVMTPDLRFAIRTGGPLDLRLRVARNGDTCVENRGPQAPTLAVTDPFGEALYELLPNQHVLFEHGSLHEVVDHESTPCGCPDAGMSVADALLQPAATLGAGEQHPFPTAQSEGLAPGPEVPQAPPGQVHAQVTETMSYSARPAEPAATVATPAPAAPPKAAAKPSTKPEAHRDLAHAIGHFFHKIFGHN